MTRYSFSGNLGYKQFFDLLRGKAVGFSNIFYRLPHIQKIYRCQRNTFEGIDLHKFAVIE